jgi:thymidylate synthase (FAD)
MTSKTFEDIQRVDIPAMNKLIGKVYPVLDKGHIRVIDYFGGDEAIVQAARVSYGKGTKQISEDRGLIRYLLRNRHTTPFEMCELKLHVRIPMDAWRQMIRHRTANVNEYSTRYSEAIDDKQCTSDGGWRRQSKSNKQGSGDFLDPLEDGRHLTDMEKQFHSMAADVYSDRIARGVAREQARKDLPLSTYTEAYWKMDLHNLLHYLSLRMDSHAQLEIRSFANIIGDIVSTWCPLTWEAFEDYRLNAMALSQLDIDMLQGYCSDVINIGVEEATKTAISLAGQFGWLGTKKDGSLKDNRERSEFDAKAARLGFEIDWSMKL